MGTKSKGNLKRGRRGERGATLVEFSIGALVFLTSVFAVLEFGRLLWVHNALTDAARRGARYAVNHTQTDADKARRMAVYGTLDDGASPMVSGLTTSQVAVNYNNFNVGEGTVTVKIDSYDFKFVVPLVGTTIRMPEYTSTLTAENAGTEPAALP